MRSQALSSNETTASGLPAGRQGLAGGTLALYALLVFCWGTSWYAMKLQVGVVAPEVSIVWRFLIAAPVMLAWAAARGMRLRYPLADHARFALMGVLMFSTNFILAYYGAGLLTSGLVSVVFSLTSIINLILGALLLGQPIEGRVALAALMGAGGVGLMFLPDLAAAQGASGVLAGLGFSAAATLCFCLGNMVSARLQKRRIAVLPASAWGMFYGTAWAAVVAWLTGATFTVEWTTRYLGSLVFLSLSATVLAFFAYLTLLGRIGAARAGYATVMFPVVALGVSTLLEDYVWSLAALAGLVLVLAGNLVVLTRPAPRS